MAIERHMCLVLHLLASTSVCIIVECFSIKSKKNIYSRTSIKWQPLANHQMLEFWWTKSCVT